MTYEEAVKTGLTIRLHQNDYDVMLPNGFTTTDYAEAISQMILQGVPSLMDLNRELQMAQAEEAFATGGFATTAVPETLTIKDGEATINNEWLAAASREDIKAELIKAGVSFGCKCPTLLNGHWPNCGEKK